MELHQLRYVVAVVDTGSFTAAASLMNVSQSGVSTQVQKLERELGVLIFDRTARRIAVTPEGEHMLPALRDAVAAIDAIRTRAGDLRGLVIGSLRIGAVTGLGWLSFFDAVNAIHGAHPGVDVRLIESTSDQLIAGVRDGTLDVAVAAWTGSPPAGLESATVFDDPLVAFVAAGHPWSARRSISPAELPDVDLILLPPGTGARQAVDEMLPRARIDLQPRWEVASPAYLSVLASRGLGVAIASETTLADSTDLVPLRIDDAQARSQLGVIWRSDPAPATRALLDRLSVDDPALQPRSGTSND